MLTNPKVKSMFNLSLGEVDFASDITGFELASRPLPPERVTFSKYTSGTAVEWQLRVGAVFDGGSAGSLHDFIWNNAGQNASFLLKPFQETDPLTKRFYLGTIRIPYRPDIKLSAGDISKYEYAFKVIGQPSRGDSPSGFMTAGYYDNY